MGSCYPARRLISALLAGAWAVASGTVTAAPSGTAAPLATVSLTGIPEAALPVLAEAQRLLGRGEAAAALALLSPLEPELAAVPLFDYLLGVAALDSGRIADALFSLARVVAAAPEFDGARMELARAEFEAGNLDAARVQFRYLAGRSPPPATAAVIDRYLAAIDRGAPTRDGRFSGFVEAGGGYDSNANASTADQQFLGFDLNARNVEADSAFATLTAGIGHQAGIGRALAVASGARLDWRVNPDARFVDQLVVSAGSTLLWSRNAWRGALGANGYYGWLDGSPQEAYAGLTAGIGRLLGDRWELAARVQGGPVRFQQDALEVLDVDRYLGSVTLTRYGLGATGGRLGLALLAGHDAARAADSPFGNDRLGIRLTAALPVAATGTLLLEAGYLEARYDGDPPFFGDVFGRRTDDQWNALAAWEISAWPGRDWSLAPRLRYTRNDSTIPLYDYDRWEAAITLRRAFR